jgi:hypothetical protein
MRYTRDKQLTAFFVGACLFAALLKACGDGEGASPVAGASGPFPDGARRDIAFGETTRISCPDFRECGGDPVGAWQLDGVCVDVLRQSIFREPARGACGKVWSPGDATGSSGTADFYADGSMKVELNLRLRATIRYTFLCSSAISKLPDGTLVCDQFQAELNQQADSATCTNAVSWCNCMIDASSHFSLAVRYRVSGTSLVTDVGPLPFCVTRDVLQMVDDDGVFVFHRKS